MNKNQRFIHSVTLIKSNTDKHFLSILIDYQLVKYEQLDTVIGLDLGIKDFIVDSNGNRFENKHFYKNKERHIKFLSKCLSRKQKGSKNRNKARIKLAKVHEKIVNQRNNYLHQITSMLVNENQVICIEDLNVNGML
ncbi:transposase [bacterium]|nr:transposase [bacterium]